MKEKLINIIGFAAVMVGGAGMDSDYIVLPIILVAVGLVVLIGGNYDTLRDIG
jgi:hypothetical protein